MSSFDDFANILMQTDDELDEIANLEGGVRRERERSPTSNPIPTSASGQSASASSRNINYKSGVWQYFIVFYKNDIRYARCKKCAKEYKVPTGKGSGGTGSISRHVQNAHPGWVIEPDQAQIISEATGAGSSRQSLWKYSEKRARKGLCEWIVQCEHPFTLASDDRFIDMIRQCYQPLAKKISNKTIRDDCMAIFSDRKEKLVNMLLNFNGMVCLTSDVWTSPHMFGYISLTCHWIDSEWNIQKRIIMFKRLEHPHTGLNIAHTIERCINEYGLLGKVFSISFDDAANNNTACSQLLSRLQPILGGKLFHIRCACHIINLCVQSGLELIRPHIGKIRGALQFIQSSGHRKQEFKAHCRFHNMSYKQFGLDVVTRWNSTRDMLKGCIPYRHVIEGFYNDKFPSDPIVSDDWDKASLILTYLEVFYVATNKLGGTYYPTSPQLLPSLLSMANCFRRYRDSELYVDICSPMEAKFKKYWQDIPLIGCLASCMDPRLKLRGVEYLVGQVYGALGLIDVDCSSICRQIYDCLFELYDIYVTKHSSQVASSSSQPSTSDVLTGTEEDYAFHLWQATSSSQPSVGSSNYNELQFYLSRHEPPLDSKLDLLAWWKVNGPTWPILSAMARDLLTAPMSTVASESCFSAGSRVLDEKRMRLKDPTIEMCICLKDWLDADRRNQGSGALYDYESEDNDVD